MIIKLVSCEVKPQCREQFACGQEAWGALREVDGFCGQTGGWNQSDPGQAVIVGLWRDVTTYARFMSEIHDPIVERNGHAGVNFHLGRCACAFSNLGDGPSDSLMDFCSYGRIESADRAWRGSAKSRRTPLSAGDSVNSAA